MNTVFVEDQQINASVTEIEGIDDICPLKLDTSFMATVLQDYYFPDRALNLLYAKR